MITKLIVPTLATPLLLTGLLAADVESRSTSNSAAARYPPATPALPRGDAKGNPLKRAPTGHISNYDEAKVGAYTLPDPLVLQNGEPVRTADQWFQQRRSEIINLYEKEIYGRIPE